MGRVLMAWCRVTTFNGTFHDRGGAGSFQGVRSN